MTVRSFPATEFYRTLHTDYPPAFSDANHLLRRAAQGEDLYELHGRRVALLMRWFLESRALTVMRKGWHLGPHAPRSVAIDTSPESSLRGTTVGQVVPYDVVGMFMPARPDYAVLLAPGLQELKRRGLRVAVLAEDAAAVDPVAFAGLDIFDLEHWATLRTYVAARATYQQSATDRLRFERTYALSRSERRNVELTLRALFWQQYAFTSAMAALRPRALLGLQFTLFPGVAAALREQRASHRPIRVFLIQHGVFSGSWPEHDFHGADLLLTWGPYFSEELASFMGPHPPTMVVGHPRLEALLESQSGSPSRPAPDDDPAAPHCHRVLYLGTNGIETDDTAALQLVAHTLKQTERCQVCYLPHPSESMQKYQDLQSLGFLKPDQVLRNRSAYNEVIAADLVLGTQTTMLPEALALGVPVIQIAPERFEVDWHRRGMLAASNPTALKELVHAALTDAAFRSRILTEGKPLATHMFGSPRGVTTRIADIVESGVDGYPEEPSVGDAQPGPGNRRSARGARNVGLPERGAA